MALHIVWLTPKWWGPREVTLRVNYKQPPCNDAHTKSKNVWHIHVFYCTSSSTLATLLPIPQQAAVATGERTMRFSGDLARFRTAREGRCRLARSFSSGILDCLIHLFLIHTLWSGDRRSYITSLHYILAELFDMLLPTITHNSNFPFEYRYQFLIS